MNVKLSYKLNSKVTIFYFEKYKYIYHNRMSDDMMTEKSFRQCNFNVDVNWEANYIYFTSLKYTYISHNVVSGDMKAEN